MNIKKTIVKFYNQFNAWKSSKKIVVFESDDWGNLGMPNKDAQSYLLNKLPACKNNPYILFDSLESPSDLSSLFELLLRFRDREGNFVKFTANTVVANPNFDLIATNSFDSYYFETINETFDKYFPSGKMLHLYHQGINSGVFYPQFHGREHLNYARWMHHLRNGDAIVRDMFHRHIFDLSTSDVTIDNLRFSDALNYFDLAHLRDQPDDLNEGLNLFENFFGYRSSSFIAPVYTWHPSIEEPLAKAGVTILQGGAIQKIPTGIANKRKNSFHYLGQKNKHNQVYLVRNCIFEPSILNRTSEESISNCLLQMERAFNLQIPAIISTHRINYVSRLSPQKHQNNLKALQKLLQKMLIKWPDLIFMDSSSLGKLIKVGKL